MVCACTGLPPGELQRTTTACVFLSLKAACSEAVTRSALASVLGAMTPLTSTMAVCFLPLLISARPLQSTAMTRMKVRYAKVSSLKKMPQRRARRCSFKAAVARLATRSRSHCGLLSVIVESHEVDRAVALLELQLHQRRAVARPAEAASGCRLVERAVRRAYQMASVGIEKYPFLP